MCSQEVKKSNNASGRSKRSLYLCKYYLGGECTPKKGRCQFLHVCKRFLEGSCNQASCLLSHDLDDDQNSSVLQRHFFGGIGSLVEQTRTLLPHICVRYTQSDCNKNDCNNLHICAAFVQGTCSGSCSLEKSHDLQSYHNSNVLIKYYENSLKRFSQWKGLIISSILILSDVQELCGYLRFQEQPIPLGHVVEKFGDEIKGTLLSNRQIFYIRMQKEDEWSVFAKVELKLCENYLSGMCPASRSCSKLHICKAFVLGAQCCRNLKDCQLGLSHDLKAFDNNSTLLTNAGISHLSCQAVIRKLRYSLPFVCKNFATKAFCSVFDCGCLHLCPHFAAGSCSRNCPFSYKFSLQQQFVHNLASTENRVILESAGLSILKQHRNFTLANILYPPEFFPDHRHALSNVLVRDSMNVVDGDTPTQMQVLAAHEESSLVLARSGKNAGPTSIDVGITTKVPTEKKQPTDLAVGKESLPVSQGKSKDKAGPTVGITTEVPTKKKQPTALAVGIDNSVISQGKSKDKAGPTSVAVGITAKVPTEKKQPTALAVGNDNSVISQGKSIDKAGPTSVAVGITAKVPTEKKLPTALAVGNDNSLISQGKSEDKTGPTSIEVGISTKVPTEKKQHTAPALDIGPASIGVVFATEVPAEKKRTEALEVSQVNSLITLGKSTDKTGDTSPNSYLCHNWVLGKCSAGKDCLLLHVLPRFPYFWRYKRISDPSKGWSKFGTDAMKALEEAFCSPETVSYMVELEDDTKILVDFENMTGQFLNDQTSCEIHRQTTKSSACLPSAATKLALTDWCWYWLDNAKRWNEYEIDGKKASDRIEKHYSEGKGPFRFSTSEFSYTIDVAKMVQVNQDERYRTVRSVRRRPVFKSIEDFGRDKKTGFDLPKHWPNVDVSDGYKLIKVNPASQVWKSIKKSFIETIQATLPTAWVVSISEVCNPAFFSKYQSMKETMIKKLGQQHLNEKRLYHGTDHSIVEAICHQNFDWRLCGKNATAYGEGCYFATTASYSHGYCKMDSNGVYYMFYADVLTGMYAQGDRNLKRPPARSGLDLYDSCVNSTTSPSMYIVFERDQCYPRFLIAYKAQKDANTSGTSHAGLGASSSSSRLVSSLSTAGGTQGASSYGPSSAYHQAAYGFSHTGLGASSSAFGVASGSSSSSGIQGSTSYGYNPSYYQASPSTSYTGSGGSASSSTSTSYYGRGYGSSTTYTVSGSSSSSTSSQVTTSSTSFAQSPTTSSSSSSSRQSQGKPISRKNSCIIA